MSVQINYVLVSIDTERNTQIQVFTEYEEASPHIKDRHTTVIKGNGKTG